MTVEALKDAVNRAPRFVPPAPKPASLPVVRRLEYTLADQLHDQPEVFDDELIEGVIGRAAMAVIYGDTNSGKTFLAIDLGAAICLQKKWLGQRPTADGIVVYLATEAVASVERRLRAYQRHHGVRVPGFVIVRSPINLFDGNADVTAVVALVENIERELGAKAALIIGDTLARISAGANENSGEDMGVVLRNADAIRDATGATFLWIHHCGKDQARGMRGWSGVRAAVDTEIEITADEATGVRTAEVTKQRDLPGKGDRFGFRLEPVNLGQNRWGTPRGSCVVIPEEAAPKSTTQSRRTSEVAGAIVEVLRANGTGMKKSAIVKHFEGQYDKASVYREMKRMHLSGRLYEVAGVFTLVKDSKATTI